jgi:catalase
VEGGARNYGRDGLMRFDSDGGSAKNYEPNSYGAPVQSGHRDDLAYDGSGPVGPRYDLAYDVSGSVGPRGLVRHAQDDDFVQAGMLYRVMTEDAKARLIENLAASLAGVTRPEVVERQIAHFRPADADYGRRVGEAVIQRRRA